MTPTTYQPANLERLDHVTLNLDKYTTDAANTTDKKKQEAESLKAKRKPPP